VGKIQRVAVVTHLAELNDDVVLCHPPTIHRPHIRGHDPELPTRADDATACMQCTSQTSTAVASDSPFSARTAWKLRMDACVTRPRKSRMYMFFTESHTGDLLTSATKCSVDCPVPTNANASTLL
jgi:hypothetical protein